MLEVPLEVYSQLHSSECIQLQDVMICYPMDISVHPSVLVHRLQVTIDPD